MYTHCFYSTDRGMPATLYYYVPQFLDETLQGLTAVKPEPLSSIAKLLLSFTVQCDFCKENPDEMAWRSLQCIEDQPWAAQWVAQAHVIDDHQNFTWMALYPTYCHISIRSIRHERIGLNPVQLQNWYSLIKEVFHEDDWKVSVVEECLMLGLCSDRHPAAMKVGAFEVYSLWLQRKTELEMRLFSGTQSGGFDWGGANSVETAGSGSLNAIFSEHVKSSWTTAYWSLWISEQLKWRALASYHTIAIEKKLSSQGMQLCSEDIWIDASLWSSVEMSEALVIGKQLWFNNTCRRMVVTTRLQSHAIEFCLPAWPFWKRWGYYFYCKTPLTKQLLTYSDVMKKLGVEN